MMFKTPAMRLSVALVLLTVNLLLSLEDELIRQNCRPRLVKFLSRHKTKGGLFRRKLNLYLVRRAQRGIERRHREARRALLQHDRQTGRLLAFSGHME